MKGNIMKSIILYGSKYGTTKQYAEEFSRRTGIKVHSYKEVKNLSEYDTVIYFGSLYAGGVTGLPKTAKRLSGDGTQRLVIITVGLASPADKANADHIKESIRRQIPADIFQKADIFHLRGGIDYQKLHVTHRLMMKLFYNQLKKQPEQTRSAETQAIIDTYNQTVNFVDFDSLNPVAELLHLL